MRFERPRKDQNSLTKIKGSLHTLLCELSIAHIYSFHKFKLIGNIGSTVARKKIGQIGEKPE